MAVITLEKTDEKSVNLVIEPMHSNGVYKVHVHKEEVEGNFSTWMPFEKGNFNVTIGQGRKSQKKINTINNYIVDNSNKLKGMWLDNKYHEMAGLFETILK